MTATREETEVGSLKEKITVGACALVIALVGVVWAVTWGNVGSQVDDATAELKALKHDANAVVERVKAVEINREEIFRRLDRIEKKLEAVDDKLGTIIRKVEK
jgi:outer membrane murein-binding lipoprotein Lpp